MRLVFGAVGSDGFIDGTGAGSPPLAATTASGTTVVWFPDSKTETKTRPPAASRASARGCLPKTLSVCGGEAGAPASKTLTSLRPETQTNACAPPGPAKRTSVGSSPTSIVRTTFPVERSTTLTESDSQLTTHASRSLRAATLTGSSPTGISAVRTGAPEESWNTESVAFGELTASRRVPSGVSASGRACGLSKLRKGAGSCAEAGRPPHRHRRGATVSASADLRTSLLRAGATRGVRLDIGGLPVSAALGSRAARGVLCKQK